MATRIPALIQLSDPRVAAQLVLTTLEEPVVGLLFPVCLNESCYNNTFALNELCLYTDSHEPDETSRLKA